MKFPEGATATATACSPRLLYCRDGRNAGAAFATRSCASGPRAHGAAGNAVWTQHCRAQQVPPLLAQSLSCLLALPCWADANGTAATTTERAIRAMRKRRMIVSLGTFRSILTQPH